MFPVRYSQPECWCITSWSVGILPAGVLGFSTSWSAGGLPAGVLEFSPAKVLGVYQPECWGFTSQSVGALPAGVLGFYQVECGGVFQSERWDASWPWRAGVL